MNLFGLSPGELFLIMFVAMIVLGPEKLPETAASIGKWIREFRRATQELTQQFAEDNPFADLQKALALNDEPTVIFPGSSPATSPTVEPVFTPPAPIAEAQVAMATSSLPAGLAPVVVPRSDYFDRPVLFSPIEDRWVHGSIEDFDYRAISRVKPQINDPIADEWAHGVPLFVATTPVEPGESNEQLTPVVSDFVNSLNFSFGMALSVALPEVADAAVDEQSSIADAEEIEESIATTTCDESGETIVAQADPGDFRADQIEPGHVVVSEPPELAMVGSASGRENGSLP